MAAWAWLYFLTREAPHAPGSPADSALLPPPQGRPQEPQVQCVQTSTEETQINREEQLTGPSVSLGTDTPGQAPANAEQALTARPPGSLPDPCTVPRVPLLPQACPQ